MIFFDDFENGLQNWSNNFNWQTVTIDGNHVFFGRTHTFEQLLPGLYGDYAVTADVRLGEDTLQGGGSFHFNYRSDPEKSGDRYFLDIMSDRISLNKQLGNSFFNDLDSYQCDLRDGWHNITVDGFGNNLTIYLDGSPVITYEDGDRPILSGNVSIETLSGNQSVYIDNVRIFSKPAAAVSPSTTNPFLHPGYRLLFCDTFDNGRQNWSGNSQWKIVTLDNNRVLAGNTHTFTELLPGPYGNHTVTADFMLGEDIMQNGGGFHFNYRSNPAGGGITRYFIGVSRYSITLSKQLGSIFFNDLGKCDYDLSEGWHNITIDGFGSNLTIYIDGRQAIHYEDRDMPISSGSVSIETLGDNQSVSIDNVTISGEPAVAGSFPFASLLPVAIGSAAVIIALTGIITGRSYLTKRRLKVSPDAGHGNADPSAHPVLANASASPDNFKHVTGHQVFISYSSHDKPVGDAICAALESEGIRCWIAPRDILAGVNYQESIIDAIDSSGIMVLVFSANSNRSPHVIRELTRAVSRELVIIPFKIEDAPMSKSMEYLISIPHWLDAMTPPLEAHIGELAQSVKMNLKSEATDKK